LPKVGRAVRAVAISQRPHQAIASDPTPSGIGEYRESAG